MDPIAGPLPDSKRPQLGSGKRGKGGAFLARCCTARGLGLCWTCAGVVPAVLCAALPPPCLCAASNEAALGCLPPRPPRCRSTTLAREDYGGRATEHLICLLHQLNPLPVSGEDIRLMRASFMLTHRVPAG